MSGVPRELVEHHLNTDPKLKPVKQFLRRFNDERMNTIGEEIDRILAAGFIMEVFLSGMACKPGPDFEKEWDLAYVHRLH